MSVLYPDLYRTKFPDSLDEFKDFLNIAIGDGSLIKQYQSAINAGSPNLALAALEQISGYERKILTADDLNKVLDAVRALERFYKRDVYPYINNKESDWKQEIEKFSYKGDYVSYETYEKNNYVTYGEGASKYVYIAVTTPPQGAYPTDERYWRKLTVQGKKGEAGKGLAFLGKWDTNTNYKVDDIVEFTGKLWGCIAPNISKPPSEYNSYWRLLYDLNITVFPMSAQRPTGQTNDELWFRLV